MASEHSHAFLDQWTMADFLLHVQHDHGHLLTGAMVEYSLIKAKEAHTQIHTMGVAHGGK